MYYTYHEAIMNIRSGFSLLWPKFSWGQKRMTKKTENEKGKR